MRKSAHLFLAVLIAVLALPSITLAQPMIGGFQGTVAAGGAGLPDGTLVTAWIEGAKVGEAQTGNSMYSMFVSGDYTDKTVNFKVGKYEAEQTATWKRAETQPVDLSINSWPYQCDFYGKATVDGTNVPDGTVVSAWIDTARVQTTVTTDSLYHLVVPGNYAGKAVSFKIGNDYATQIVLWERGMEFETNLSVSLGPLVCGFYGSVTLDGEDVIDGTEVSAWVDSVKVQTTTTAGSKYGLNIPGNFTGKSVSFRVGDHDALEGGTWARGGNKQVSLTAITTGSPVVTLNLSPQEVIPGEGFILSVNVNPNGHGISGGEIALLDLDSDVMEILLDKVTAGDILGTDPIEGVKEKTISDGGETLEYALARKGPTAIPTEASTLAVIGLVVKANAKAGKYAIPNAVSLTDENFDTLDFAPPTASITVIASIPGDINGDGSVGLADLAMLAATYGSSSDDGDTFPLNVDLNGDDEIGLGDLAILAGSWGRKD